MSTDTFVASGNSPGPDFVLQCEGSLFLLHPQNPNAVSWIEENIGENNGYQPMYPVILIEHRFISDILAGLNSEGFAVSR